MQTDALQGHGGKGVVRHRHAVSAGGRRRGAWLAASAATVCVLLAFAASATSAAGLVEGVVQGVVGTIAGLAPIPGPLLSQLAPLTSPLNALLRQALERGDATALSTAIVTAGRAIIALLVKAALPVLPPIRPDTEAPRYGYHGEYYNVTTTDGYILGLFRVNNPKCTSFRSVAVVAPAVFCNAGSFMFLGKDSLVYQLAERCHDVWLMSFRGDAFGRGHTRLSDKTKEFWDFYQYHFGVYDMPAQLEFVSKKTGSTAMRYVGSDHACAALLFMNHVHGDRYQRLLAGAYLMAPIGYLGRLKSPAFAALGVARDLLTAAGAVATHNELPFWDPTVHSVFFNLCARISPETCYLLYNLLGGPSTEVNQAALTEASRNTLDSTSIDAYVYYGQQFGKPKYMAYLDYGKEENLRRYNSSTPIPVRIDRTTVKCSFFAVEKSTVAVPEDSLDTFNALAASARSHYEVLSGYNSVSPFIPVHPDGIWGVLVRRYELELGQKPRQG